MCACATAPLQKLLARKQDLCSYMCVSHIFHDHENLLYQRITVEPLNEGQPLILLIHPKCAKKAWSGSVLAQQCHTAKISVLER